MRDIMISAALATMLCAPALQAAEADKAALAAEGKSVMMSFGKALKGELQAAMKAEGPVKAIQVCYLKAPKIAKKVSETSGWTVRRSSHKLRNRNNQPDAFTRTAMEEFLARQAKGEKAAKMAKVAIVEEGGQKLFRLVKAIPTEKLCLTCHGGADVKPEVEKALKRQYPTDAARGFKEGEMRGVFTLSKVLK